MNREQPVIQGCHGIKPEWCINMTEKQYCKSYLDVSSFVRYDSICKIWHVRHPAMTWEGPARIVSIDNEDSESRVSISFTPARHCMII
jgi:hypothetical protein